LAEKINVWQITLQDEMISLCRHPYLAQNKHPPPLYITFRYSASIRHDSLLT